MCVHRQAIGDWADRQLGGTPKAGPDSRLKYTPPSKIFRGKDDPLLSSLTGAVVIKTSWTGIDRRDSEANMFSDCNNRFGVMPHVCSYEVSGKNGQVISNILFFPEADKIGGYHWDVFGLTAPQTLDVRIYKQIILATHGKPFTEAESPTILTHALAHSLLGLHIVTLFQSRRLNRCPSRVVICIYIRAPARGS